MADNMVLDEEMKAFILENERDILEGLLSAKNYRDNGENHCKVTVNRGGKVFFTFHVRPLTEEEYLDCLRDATKYGANNRIGLKTGEETDICRFHTNLVYLATVKEDREKIWNNRVFQEKLGVLTGKDMIETVFLAGEKRDIVANIEEISGSGDGNTVEIAKN